MAWMVATLGMNEAWAQTISPEKVQRGQELYDAAIALMEQSKFSEACPKLEEVVRLVPDGVGAKIELARCYENDGRLASAWRAYKIAEASAAQAGQAERNKKAAERAKAIEPILSSLLIIVPDSLRSLPGFEITRNGTKVDPMDWGTAIPVDGGTYRLEATANGKQRWTTTVEILPTNKQERVEVGVLLDVAKPAETPQKRIPPPVRAWQKPVGGVLAGAGFVGAVAGSILGGLAISTHNASNADNHCDIANRCDGTGLDLRKDALAYANASTGLIIAGGVLLAGGVVLFATAPPNPSAATHAYRGAAVQVEAGPRGVTIHGLW